MIVFPNAKINLGLQVSAKRPDGYHNIATIFYPVGCTDVLEALPAGTTHFATSGLSIDVPIEKNLCYKAYTLLQKDYQLPPVAAHLHKSIPMGAGLGGGSADGAFMLSLLNQLFRLNLSAESLCSYALQLGSDCPFFIMNRPAYATGRGELLEPVEIPQMQEKKILLVNPGLHINTGWAFGQLKISPDHPYLPDIIREPMANWRGRMENDFEPVVFAAFPQLKQIQEILYTAGAVFAGMTGTGSTLFGIFDSLPDHFETLFDPEYKIILA